MTVQMDIFGLLGDTMTPTIPPAQQVAGAEGWYVETVRRVHDYTDDARHYAAVACRARRVRLDADPVDGKRLWWNTVDYSDWYAGGTCWDYRKLFARRPTDNEILREAREQMADDPRAAGVPFIVEDKPERSDDE